ncbi:MAG: M23 family metallopeptidase [Rhodocyclaceae bacterium]|nr:M23 family metallopeptidase [Rhodocyclaceae bacterium]MBR4876883.1 M23 family metallopeptidase [Rhodocyclaceae bacterium]
MAFVIVSSGAVSHARTRTMSARMFGFLLCIAFAAMLAAGFLVGRLWPAGGQGATELFQSSSTTRQVDNRLLVDRVGELSGKLIQLEAEAAELVERLSAVQDFDRRTSSAELEKAKRRLARTQPGVSGGPRLSPRKSQSDKVHDNSSRNKSAGEGLAPRATATGLLGGHLAVMGEDIEQLDQVLRDIDKLVVSLNTSHMFFPSRSPISGGRINSSFGNRRDPFTGELAFHSGQDFPVPVGTPVRAAGGGLVVFAGPRAAYGITVEIDHGSGVVTRYAHNSEVTVKVGDVVRAGDVVAKSGSTGRSTGPHLHFEVLKDGYFMNPNTYLAVRQN